jgi:hypothetical protein
MVDIVLEITASLFGTVIDDWFPNQSWWVKAIVVGSFVFAVLMVCYFTIFFPVFGNPRGG